MTNEKALKCNHVGMVTNGFCGNCLVEGLGPDIPAHTNEKGAAQSDIPFRADLLDGMALLHIAAILKKGADKYGANNWRKLTTDDHINHALVHILAYLSGDVQDDHLGHGACRMMMALAAELARDW